MRKIRFSDQAKADFKKVLEVSEQEFGQEVARRYMHLLDISLVAIMTDPNTVGSQTVDRYPDLVRYPIHWSSMTAKVEGRVVRNPRHVIYFRDASESNEVQVVRILHDSLDPELHL